MASGFQILLAGDIKSNIQKLRNPDYGLLSYRDYYAIGVMEQVEAWLKECGFGSIHMFREMSTEPPGKDCQRVVIAAGKEG